MKLNELVNFEGARKNRKRVGRGIGSGTGKTSGRGVKGQKARSGVTIKGEGGQMPLVVRLPKLGFRNIHKINYITINLSRLQKACEANKFKDGDVIDIESFYSKGIVSKKTAQIALLGTGDLKHKLHLKVSKASKSAIEKVEKLGGKVEIIGKA